MWQPSLSGWTFPDNKGFIRSLVLKMSQAWSNKTSDCGCRSTNHLSQWWVLSCQNLTKSSTFSMDVQKRGKVVTAICSTASACQRLCGTAIKPIEWPTMSTLVAWFVRDKLHRVSQSLQSIQFLVSLSINALIHSGQQRAIALVD